MRKKTRKNTIFASTFMAYSKVDQMKEVFVLNPVATCLFVLCKRRRRYTGNFRERCFILML